MIWSERRLSVRCAGEYNVWVKRGSGGRKHKKSERGVVCGSGGVL